MNEDKYISNISEKMWEGYLNGTLLTSEKKLVEEYLHQYSEYLADVKNLSREEYVVVKRISKKLNKRVRGATENKKVPFIWWSVAASIVLVGVFLFNENKETEKSIALTNDKEAIESLEPKIDSLIESKENVVFVEENEEDTLFSFERKGGELEVVEVPPIKKNNVKLLSDSIIKNELKNDNTKDLVVQKEEVESVKSPSDIKNKIYSVSVEYRQTVEIEDNFYAQSKIVGKTSSYASPIKGYSYVEEGMPMFQNGDKELIDYINSKLSEDELLKGIDKKMKANLSFIVTNNGKLKDVLVQNCNHKQLGISLMSIVEEMPEWSPSEYRGKKGKAHYVLKIVFE